MISCAPTSPQVPQASVAAPHRLPRGLPVPLDAEKTGFFFIFALMVAPLLVVVTVGLCLTL